MLIKCFKSVVKVLCNCSVFVWAAVSLLGSVAEARVTRIETTSRVVVADGMSFGKTGPYEKLRGTVYFEVDPKDRRNAVVFDLDKAPRNKAGLVEFSADFVILKPTDLKKGNGGLFFEVNNRGRITSLVLMNDAPGINNNPTRVEDFGNGFLLRQGYTLAWVGWEADILGGMDRMTVHFPIAVQEDGQPITERIAIEFADAKRASSTDVFTLPLASYSNPFVPSPPYESVSTDQEVAMAELLMRPSDSRRPSGPDIPHGEVIPTSEWSFARCPDGPPGTPSTTDICLHQGFRDDLVYQLNYKAKNPIVMGLGYITTRDFIAFLRQPAGEDAGHPNPVPGIGRVLCQGVSQSAGYLRDFLYQGFNEDEQGGRVCDGAHVHVQGVDKRAVNYRFAQPNVVGDQHNGRIRPSTNFPRTYAVGEDPLAPGRMDGILKRPATDPKIIHINSSTEYWQLRASLVDTDEDGTVDLIQPDNVRLYLLSSTEHFRIKGAAPTHGIGNRQCQQLSNPTHQGVLARPLLVALDEWVRDGTPPPHSRVPRIDDGTLVPSDRESTGFPDIPPGPTWGHVNYNGLFNGSGEYDFGRRVEGNRGVIDYLIPLVRSTHQVLVPKVDEIGNEVAGIRHPFVEAPIATLTGWNLRTPEFTDGDLCFVNGMMVPLHRTREERVKAGDPRPSLQELYGDHAGYVLKVALAALNLWSQRLMLLEDVFQTIQEADDSHDAL